MEELGRLGAVPKRERYVFDGKYVTGAGVSAGIDMALALAGRVAGDEEAKRIQLGHRIRPASAVPVGLAGHREPGDRSRPSSRGAASPASRLEQ